MQVRAPRGVELEDRIVFGLTASRLAWAASGAILAYAALRALPAWVAWPVVLVLSAVVGALVLFRPEARNLDAWLWAGFRYWAHGQLSARTAVRPAPVGAAPSPSSAPAPAPAVSVLEDADPAPGRDLYSAGPRILRLPVQEPDPNPDWVATPARSSAAFAGATRRVAFFSLKGGLGRTTLACETAALLAQRGRTNDPVTGRSLGLDVVLVDLDLVSSGVSMRLGISGPSWWDLTPEPGPNHGAHLQLHDTGVRVMSGPRRPLREDHPLAPDSAALISELNAIERGGAHFILLDLGGELSAFNLAVLDWCHDIYLLSGTSSTALQATYRAAEALRRLGRGDRLRYVEVQGRLGAKSQLGEVMGDLGGRVCGVIPHDPEFVRAEARQRPLVTERPQSPGAVAVARFARVIYPGLPLPEASSGRGWLRRLAAVATLRTGGGA